MHRRVGVSVLLIVCALASAASAAEPALRLPSRTPSRVPVALEPLGHTFGVHGLGIAPLACAEAEPNNTLEQATALTVPGDCGGAVASTDPSSISITYNDGSKDGIEDIFIVTLTKTMRLNVDLTWSSSGADLDLFVFRRNGSQLETVEGSVTDGAVAEGLTTDPLAPGTYYIGVSAFSGSTLYTVVVSEQTTSSTCTEDTTSICLNNGRFRVRTTWTSPTATGNGGGVRLTGDTGLFWFFNNANVELVVKVLNACALNNRFWVFAGGLTDVKVKISITDTTTGATKEFDTAGGSAFAPIQDTDAFATCSGTACTFNVTPTSQSYGASGGSGTVGVTSPSGCTWNATSGASWITINSGTPGSGNGTVAYTVATNGTTSARSGTMTVAGKTVAISQAAGAACNYTVSPTSQSFTSAGGSATATVTTESGCTWTATTTTPWITINSGASGTGNGVVSYTAAANTGTTSRSGSLSVAGRTVSVSQTATATCTYTLSPTSKEFEFGGGTGTFNVNTQPGCTWTATTTTPWIAITSGASGTGNGTVGYSVEANPGTGSRSGSISAGGRSFSVTEKGDTSKCAYSLEYTEKNFTWCGADGSFKVTTTSGCPWTISSTTPWITPLLNSYSGEDSASYLVARNTTGAAREGTLTVRGTAVTIRQSARADSNPRDGLWAGTTDENREVTACVANNAIQTLSIRVRLDTFSGGCITPLVRFNPLPITGSNFSGTVQTYPEISNAFTTLTGSFPSNTSMTGSWPSFSGGFYLICGNTVTIGFGTILDSGSMTATKQP